MTNLLKININDLTQQFIHELKQKFGDASEVEIRIPQKKRQKEMFSDAEFWQVIDRLDWSKENASEVMASAVALLAAMPVVNIYLFQDKLAEKLYQLDTRQHGNAYLSNEKDDYLSVDDFLYIRCAVVAEGKNYYEKIVANPAAFPADLSFEPLLNLASLAYKQKTGKEFNYHPVLSYETYSNKQGWK